VHCERFVALQAREPCGVVTIKSLLLDLKGYAYSGEA
jgi:hypothetical protein